MSIFAMACAYALAAAIPVALGQLDDQTIKFAIANVLAFALMSRCDYFAHWRNLLGIFIGSMAIQLMVSSPLEAVAASVVTTGFVGISLWLTRGLFGHSGLEGMSPRTFGLLILTLGGAAWLAAVLVAVFSGLKLNLPMVATVSRWFLADAVGAAMMLPICITISRRRLAGLMEYNRVFRAFFWTVFCGISAWVALEYSPFPFVVVIVPMLLAALQLKPFELSFPCFAMGASAMAWMATTERTIPWTVEGVQAGVVVALLVTFLAGLLLDRVRKVQRSIAQSERRYRSAMRDAPVGLAIIDMKGKILESNVRFAEMTGYEISELEGLNVSDITPPEDRNISAEVFAAFWRGEDEPQVFQKRYQHKDGRLVWVEVTAIVERDSAGKPLFLNSHFIDIQTRKEAERELEQMKNRWDFALASAGQGFWDQDEVDNVTTYSSTWTSMLGYEPGSIDGNNALWLELIHPDDRDTVVQLDRAHQAGEIPFFEHEYRLRHAQGHWVWVLDRGKVIERGEEGKAKRLIGTLTDISQRKAIEENLERTARLLEGEKERLRVTLESIGDAVICTDAEGRITFMNAGAESMTQTLAREAMGRLLHEVYRATRQNDAEDEDGWHNATLRNRDGVAMAIREVVSPIRLGNGERAGDVIVFQDFTQLRQLQLELQHAADHDGLTGVLNRSGFVSAMEKLAGSEATHANESYLLFVDLDRFKAVNDGAGHAAGDAMLRLVAETLEETVRSSDIVARLGGDEFAVLLRRCPESFARLAAQAIVDGIEAIELDWAGRKLGVGASVGLASFGDTLSIDATMASADEACYAAKAAGGGVVKTAQDVRRNSKKRAAGGR